MRVASILTALLVATALYFLVLQRDTLLNFAGRDTDAPPAAEAQDEPLAPVEALQSAPERIKVVAMTSRASSIDTAVLVRGRSEAARRVDVAAETSGRIINDPRRKGALVEAGELLCEIAPGTREAALSEARARLKEARASLPESRARVTEAEARLEEAQINDRAAESLSESGFAAQTRVAATRAAVASARANLESARTGLESAQSAVQAAEAAVATAETEIERLTITAPFAGVLEGDTAELGALMQPGQICATILQLDPIKLVGFVPESAVDRVEVGAQAGAQLASGRRVRGEVTYVARSADPQTRTFRVEVEVPNPDLTIRDGQTVEIAISAAGAQAHLVPASALTLDDAGRLGLRVVQDDPEKGDVAAFVPVEMVRDTTNGVFVAGLGQEARVIVVGQEYVTDGVRVDATLREQAPAATGIAGAAGEVSQ